MRLETQPLNQNRIVLSHVEGKQYLRDGRRIPKPPITAEAFDRDALATLLYANVVYPPKTVFKGYSAVCMGGDLELSSNSEVVYKEIDDVLVADGVDEAEDFDAIDDLAASLDASRVDFESTVLFLSEGKDSVSIAMALAELGVKVDCFTFANSDTNVEFVEKIAKQLGHPHRVFRYSAFEIGERTLERLSHVFEPTLDQAFLSYLLLPVEEFSGRTIIDGSGNDIYMGHLPSKDQLRATVVCDLTRRLIPQAVRQWLQPLVCNDRPYSGIPFRSFSECQGLFNGFSESMICRSVGGSVMHPDEINRRWRSIGFEHARALCRGRHLVTYCFNGKAVSLAEMAEGNVWFPWTDANVARRYLRLADGRRFEWPSKNKLPLRDAINRRTAYSQPKVGFRAPTQQILSGNRTLIDRAIKSSVSLGAGLKDMLVGLPSQSPRLAVGALYALWEYAVREYQPASVSSAESVESIDA